jgi:dihydroneopterin aldolase/2-amino-4-hydroxy-6-hydroxymethyldihydropteridine diphosphokinase
MLVETFMRPEFLLNFLNQIELEEGRVRAEHWGPRTLDLDIVFYEEEIIHTDRLVVPHIDMHNREFVLQPLCEIAPYAYHPIFKKTVKQLLFDYRNR